MEVYIAYEVISVIMLAITLAVYNYKNWIGVRRNRLYVLMVSTAIVSCIVNIVFFEIGIKQAKDTMMAERVADMLRALSVLMGYFVLLLYDMAMTKTLAMVKKAWFKLVVGLFVMMLATVVVGAMTDYTYFMEDSWLGRSDRGNKVPCIFIAGSLAIGSGIVIRYRTRLKNRETRVLVITNIVLFLDMVNQIIKKGSNLTSYYIIAMVLVLYYLLLHNLDRYRNYSSGCFSMQGFQDLVRECAHYQKDFRCVSICINNIESITNFCSEDEIKEINHRLGSLLIRGCGRHNVFRTHSFEYIVLLKKKEDVVTKHQNLAQYIPLYYRINNKNITLSCSFYTVAFSEAGYSSSKFYCILASMRKNAMVEMDREVLRSYQGDSQLTIQKELEELRIVNTCVAKKNFAAKLAPIWRKNDDGKVSYEFVLYEKTEMGEEITLERIWEIAKETGYILEVGKISFDLLCSYIVQNRLENSDVRSIHINMLPVQLENLAIIEKFVQYLKLYRIPGEQICVEVTIDLSVNYEKLTESFMIMKNYGISVLLDQFGVTVCNIKNVLNMPFDAVKISRHIVRTYYEGKSRQLVYLLDMLEAQGWDIYLDGIDDEDAAKMIDDLHFDYMQGYHSVNVGKGSIRQRSAGGEF